MISFAYSLLKPFLFSIEPERSHKIFESLLLRFHGILPEVNPGSDITAINLGNHTLKHPVILAGGFDKYARLYPYLKKLGFSSAELGSFTPESQEGNEEPRLWRFSKDKALLNRMGFNNCGLETALQNLQQKPAPFPFSISLGKQKTTSLEGAALEYATMLRKLENHKCKKSLTYVAINISSPNTVGLRELQGVQFLNDFCQELRAATSLPLFAKLAPDFDSDQSFIEALRIPVANKFDGLILCNTSQQYNLAGNNSLEKIGQQYGGGLSGLPLSKLSRNRLIQARLELGDDIQIIASGSIMHEKDILDRILAGADAVQVYTGLIYRGPKLIKAGVKLLSNFMDKHRIKSLTQLKSKRKEFLD